jgi:hypothetical protein
MNDIRHVNCSISLSESYLNVLTLSNYLTNDASFLDHLIIKINYSYEPISALSNQIKIENNQCGYKCRKISFPLCQTNLYITIMTQDPIMLVLKGRRLFTTSDRNTFMLVPHKSSSKLFSSIPLVSGNKQSDGKEPQNVLDDTKSKDLISQQWDDETQVEESRTPLIIPRCKLKSVLPAPKKYKNEENIFNLTIIDDFVPMEKRVIAKSKYQSAEGISKIHNKRQK